MGVSSGNRRHPEAVTAMICMPINDIGPIRRNVPKGLTRGMDLDAHDFSPLTQNGMHRSEHKLITFDFAQNAISSPSPRTMQIRIALRGKYGPCPCHFRGPWVTAHLEYLLRLAAGYGQAHQFPPAWRCARAAFRPSKI